MSSACQIDFYVLADESHCAERLACQLAFMSWEQGNRILVLAENEPQAERLDAMMWEHPPGRFLPHAQKQMAGFAPVIIGTMADLVDDASEVIINLTQLTVSRPERFHRLLEFVPANEKQRRVARDKFRQYRSHGLNPQTTHISEIESGGTP